MSFAVPACLRHWPVAAALSLLLVSPVSLAQRVSARDRAAAEALEQRMAAAEKRYRDGLVLVFFHEEKGGAGYDFADWFDPATARLTWRGCVAKPEAACERPREAVLTGRGDKWRLVPWTR